jgi:cytochrome b
LKTVHVWIGYVFLINLLWRFIWGFVGGPYARWSAVLPGGKGFGRACACYVQGFIKGKPEFYAGHNPVGRIAVTIIFTALLVQGASGLILAGTDLYMPPFGGYFTEWVSAPDMVPSEVRPYAPETVNKKSYEEMRAFRAPVIETHLTTYFVILALILLHVGAVIAVELREGGATISAMFTGRKIQPHKSETTSNHAHDGTESESAP